MTNVFLYYGFNSFFNDESPAFSGNELCYAELTAEHFLIFEKKDNTYHLYVSKFNSKKEIGVNTPMILEKLVENYDKSIPEHRIAIRRYFE